MLAITTQQRTYVLRCSFQPRRDAVVDWDAGVAAAAPPAAAPPVSLLQSTPADTPTAFSGTPPQNRSPLLGAVEGETMGMLMCCQCNVWMCLNKFRKPSCTTSWDRRPCFITYSHGELWRPPLYHTVIPNHHNPLPYAQILLTAPIRRGPRRKDLPWRGCLTCYHAVHWFLKVPPVGQTSLSNHHQFFRTPLTQWCTPKHYWSTPNTGVSCEKWSWPKPVRPDQFWQLKVVQSLAHVSL